MSKEEMKRRTRALGLMVIRLVQKLPRGPVPDTIGRHLVRCGTSVGANYRAACRGRSLAEFVAKLGIVEEEADETIYWLEMLRDAGYATEDEIRPVVTETDEILSMVVASIRTSRGNAK